MSTNASTVQSPVLEGDAPLPFAGTTVPTPTQPSSGPTFYPSRDVSRLEELIHPHPFQVVHTKSLGC